MTTTTRCTAHGSGLSFHGLLLSEWIKLSSLRSTVWCCGIMFILNIGLGALLALSFQQRPDGTAALDQSFWVATGTVGIAFSQLVIAVLGALVITGEYGTGMIRSTLTAVPKRLPALLSKDLVFALVTSVVSLASIFGAALLAQLILSGKGLNLDLADGRAWGALIGGAAFLTLVGLVALFLGTIVRNNCRHLGRAQADPCCPDRAADLCCGDSSILGAECFRIPAEQRGVEVVRLRGDPRADDPRHDRARPRASASCDDRAGPVLRHHCRHPAQAAGRLALSQHARRFFPAQNNRTGPAEGAHNRPR